MVKVSMYPTLSLRYEKLPMTIVRLQNLHSNQLCLFLIKQEAGLFMVCWSGLKTSTTKCVHFVQSSLTSAMEITTCPNNVSNSKWCFLPFFGSAISAIHVQLKSRQVHDQILVEDVSQTLKGEAWRSSLKDLGHLGIFACPIPTERNNTSEHLAQYISESTWIYMNLHESTWIYMNLRESTSCKMLQTFTDLHSGAPKVVFGATRTQNRGWLLVASAWKVVDWQRRGSFNMHGWLIVKVCWSILRCWLKCCLKCWAACSSCRFGRVVKWFGFKGKQCIEMLRFCQSH